MSARLAVLLALGVAAGAAAPTAALSAQSRDTTFAVTRGALVDVTVRTGRLVVRGTDRSTGELRTDDPRVQLRTTGVGVTLAPTRTSSPTRRRGSDDDRVELLLPRGVRVVVNAGSADVDLRDIDGDVEVRTSSGDIAMGRLGGRAIVETLAGDLTIDDGVGELRVTTAAGDVRVNGLRGAADIHTTSGDVTLLDVRSSRITVESISGDASIEGTLAADARVRISTHSGDVTMRVDGGPRGTLEFETFNGELTTTGSLTMVGPASTTATRRGTTGGQRFEFGGGGSALVSISTFNGDLRFDVGRDTRR
jgi:DUF4097 and DUF4098 domain-containing protein YvlB